MEAPDFKSVGIIGAGRIGQVMAQIALRAGRSVMIANSRGPETLTSVVKGLGDGVTAGKPDDAAAADIVVIAVMWPDVPRAVEGLEWNGQIVIDPTNDFDPSDLDGRTSSEVVADLVAPARVVKAGNTMAAPVLGSDPPRGRWPASALPFGRRRRAQARSRRAVRGRRLLRRRPRWPARGWRDAAVPPSARRPQPGPAALRSEASEHEPSTIAETCESARPHSRDLRGFYAKDVSTCSGCVWIQIAMRAGSSRTMSAAVLYTNRRRAWW